MFLNCLLPLTQQHLAFIVNKADSLFLSIQLPMEAIYSLRRKIKRCCDTWPLPTLPGCQVCKTNVASGSQHPVCCAFWCRLLLPGRWLGSHGRKMGWDQWWRMTRSWQRGVRKQQLWKLSLYVTSVRGHLDFWQALCCVECLITAVAAASWNKRSLNRDGEQLHLVLVVGVAAVFLSCTGLCWPRSPRTQALLVHRVRRGPRRTSRPTWDQL